MPQTAKNGARCVERSYQLLALLDVCEHSAHYIGESGQEHVARAVGSLANVLELASEIASEIHDALELSAEFGIGADASERGSREQKAVAS
jgi:hypothetical protein